MFITFEGLDYSGKSTQAKLLVERLREAGNDVLFLREPGGTPISEKIRAILLDRSHLEMTEKAELLLFSAARTQLIAQVIRPALARGAFVVCDRFVDSTTAYQGFGRGIPLEQVSAINAVVLDGTTPSLTLLINVDVDEIFSRQAASALQVDRMEASGRPFYELVHKGYLHVATSDPERVVVINGMRTIKEIHDEIWTLVEQRSVRG